MFFNTTDARTHKRGAALCGKALKDVMHVSFLSCCDVCSSGCGEKREQHCWHWAINSSGIMESFCCRRALLTASCHQLVPTSGCWHWGTPSSNWGLWHRASTIQASNSSSSTSYPTMISQMLPKGVLQVPEQPSPSQAELKSLINGIKVVPIHAKGHAGISQHAFWNSS